MNHFYPVNSCSKSPLWAVKGTLKSTPLDHKGQLADCVFSTLHQLFSTSTILKYFPYKCSSRFEIRQRIILCQHEASRVPPTPDPSLVTEQGSSRRGRCMMCISRRTVWGEQRGNAAEASHRHTHNTSPAPPRTQANFLPHNGFSCPSHPELNVKDALHSRC